MIVLFEKGIDSICNETGLTDGKEYKVEKIDKTMFWSFYLKNDLGNYKWYTTTGLKEVNNE